MTSSNDKLNWLEDGRLTEAYDLAPLTLGHAGDMVVDGQGRAYISDTGFAHGAGEAPRPGQVLLFTESEGIGVVATDTHWANGSAVSADGSQFFLAETYGNRISVFLDRYRRWTVPSQDLRRASGRRLTQVVPRRRRWSCGSGSTFIQQFAHVDASGHIDQRLPTRGKLATA